MHSSPAIDSQTRPIAPDRPRVLFVGAGQPWRGGAGYLQRQDMLLRALRECADLSLALFDSPPQAKPPFDAPMISLPMPTFHDESWIEARALDLFSMRPMMLRWKDCAEARAIVERLNPASFDAIVAYRMDFAYFAGVLQQPHLILDIDDPEHVRGRERLRTIGRGMRDWYAWLDLFRLRHFEGRGASCRRGVCLSGE
jgi:hypothetical protein